MIQVSLSNEIKSDFVTRDYYKQLTRTGNWLIWKAHRQWWNTVIDDATLTKADPSSVIIEQDVFPDKSGEELLPILKRCRWLSIDDAFSEVFSKKLTEINAPRESTTVVTTTLRS